MIPESPWLRFLVLMLILGVGQVVYCSAVNPGILKARTGIKKGTEPWDWVWLALFGPTFVAIPAVASMTAQSPTGPLPTWAEWVGLGLFLIGSAVFLRAMGESPFFEKTVRIQTERGHYVVDTGPYRRVRHPGYVGLLVMLVALPACLGSAWAFIPAGVAAASVFVRTALEDRTLHAKLTGYPEYAARVRYRLIPGVW